MAHQALQARCGKTDDFDQMMNATCVVSLPLSKGVVGRIAQLGSHTHRQPLKETATGHQPVHLLLGRGARNGEEWEGSQPVSLLFTLRMIFTMCDATLNKQVHGGFAGLQGCPSGDPLRSAFTQ